uniref:Uncharacterized protein n=1 Tax=Cucumis sativus TaxID=3659 RepID=A0A0A0LHX4_CUCSA
MTTYVQVEYGSKEDDDRCQWQRRRWLVVSVSWWLMAEVVVAMEEREQLRDRWRPVTCL